MPVSGNDVEPIVHIGAGRHIHVSAAADASTVFRAVRIGRTVGGDIAAIEDDRAAGTVFAAADGRAVLAALGRDRAPVDGYRPAGAAVIAADARAVVVALGGDGAAVDDDGTVVMAGVAADGRPAGGMGVDRAGARALSVDGQRAARRNVDALHVQGVSVAQNQLRVAGQIDPAVHRDVAAQEVFACGHAAVDRHLRNLFGDFCLGDGSPVPAAPDISDRAISVCVQRPKAKSQHSAEQRGCDPSDAAVHI